MEGSEEMAKDHVLMMLGEECVECLTMAVVKDAELMAKGARGEPLLCRSGYISCLVSVHPLVSQ